MESPNKGIRPLDIAVVLLGDLAVFLVFVALGKTEHGIIQVRAILRTALPFAVVWCTISPWLGAYKASTLYGLKTTAWKILLIWILCGFIAVLVRSLVTDRPLTLAFALIAIAVQGALIVIWRSVFMIVSRRLSRQ